MISIVSDSTCDLSGEECAALGIDRVPLTVQFQGASYLDGFDLTHEEFYAKMRSADKLPTTSQANPMQFEEVFSRHLAQGEDIVAVTVSSKLSATMNSALIAAQSLDASRIHVVDSLSGSFGAALLLRHAVKLRDAGRSASDIAQELTSLTPRLRLFAVVDTLKYLKMGGRLSPAAALLGGALGITPVLCLQEGAIAPVGKVRGEEAGKKALLDLIQKGNPDPAYGIAFAHADAPERLERYLEYILPHLSDMPVYRGSIGPSQNPKYAGKTLREIGRLLGTSSMEAVMALLLEEPRIPIEENKKSDGEIRGLLAHPKGSPCTDTYAFDLEGTYGRDMELPELLPHPHTYCAFPKYILQFPAPTLEETIRKMTGAVAQFLEIPGRGEIQVGNFADLVVLDLKRLKTNENYVEPRVYPEGIPMVVVNGVVEVDQQGFTGRRAGRILRHQ